MENPFKDSLLTLLIYRVIYLLNSRKLKRKVLSFIFKISDCVLLILIKNIKLSYYC